MASSPSRSKGSSSRRSAPAACSAKWRWSTARRGSPPSYPRPIAGCSRSAGTPSWTWSRRVPTSPYRSSTPWASARGSSQRANRPRPRSVGQVRLHFPGFPPAAPRASRCCGAVWRTHTCTVSALTEEIGRATQFPETVSKLTAVARTKLHSHPHDETGDETAAGRASVSEPETGGPLTPEIAPILERAPRRRFAAGRQIVREGQPAALYFILSGSVTVCVEGSEGEELIPVRLGPGEFFGDLSLFDPELKRSGSVRAHTDCLAAVVSLENFRALIAAAPGLLPQLMGQIARRKSIT